MREDDIGFLPKLLWFLAGTATGTALAILYTPKPGAEARHFLGEHGRDLYVKSRDLYEKGRGIADEAAGFYERGRELMEGE